MARRCEGYIRVKTIFYERAQRVNQVFFQHKKIILVSSSYRVVFFKLTENIYFTAVRNLQQFNRINHTEVKHTYTA